MRDFTLVFDAYAKIEESLLSSRMALLETDGAEIDDDDDLDETEIDLRMARFENLLDRRPFLVSNVLLRQNPHNIATWDKRMDLFYALGDNEKTISAFKDAFSRINPKKALGKLNMLWVRTRMHTHTLTHATRCGTRSSTSKSRNRCRRLARCLS